MAARLNFVKKSRKDIPGTNIKKGDSYYWWKFRYGGKCVSLTRPARSWLTQSKFLSAMYDAEDSLTQIIHDYETDKASLGDLAEGFSEAAGSVREAGELADESLNNMPEQLQEGETGERLRQRAEDCERLADELERIEDELRELVSEEEPEDSPDKAKDDKQESVKDKALDLAKEISWDYEG